MVLIDLQKAFDTVDHEILLEKLDAMGFNHNKWFESYLKGRKQMVVVSNVSSETGTVAFQRIVYLDPYYFFVMLTICQLVLNVNFFYMQMIVP